MDRKGNILLQEDHAHRKPEVLSLSSSVYGLLTQTGTGISTNWAVFCDVENSKTSEVFQYVLDAKNNYVIYVQYNSGKHSIIVQDIFDKSAYYKIYELEDNSKPECILDWRFTEENTVLLTYLAGETQTKTKMVIIIPADNG